MKHSLRVLTFLVLALVPMAAAMTSSLTVAATSPPRLLFPPPSLFVVPFTVLGHPITTFNAQPTSTWVTKTSGLWLYDQQVAQTTVSVAVYTSAASARAADRKVVYKVARGFPAVSIGGAGVLSVKPTVPPVRLVDLPRTSWAYGQCGVSTCELDIGMVDRNVEFLLTIDCDTAADASPPCLRRGVVAFRWLVDELALYVANPSTHRRAPVPRLTAPVPVPPQPPVSWPSSTTIRMWAQAARPYLRQLQAAVAPCTQEELAVEETFQNHSVTWATLAANAQAEITDCEAAATEIQTLPIPPAITRSQTIGDIAGDLTAAVAAFAGAGGVTTAYVQASLTPGVLPSTIQNIVAQRNAAITRGSNDIVNAVILMVRVERAWHFHI